MKLLDQVTLENYLFICKYFNQSLPKTFQNWFTLVTGSHTLKIPSNNTKLYWRHSVNISTIYTWNYLKKRHVNILFYFVLLLFFVLSQKDFIISTWSGFVICLFKVIPPVLALLHGNCPLTFKLRLYFAFLYIWTYH